MNTNKISSFFAAGILILSMLACNLGKGPVPSEDTTTSVTEAASGENSTNSSGTCTNPYQPVIAGATWNYKLTGPVPDTFTRSILSVEASGFTDQDVFGTGVTRQSKWNCDNGNLIALNPSGGNSSSVSTENLTADFHTTELSGVTLPSALNPGDIWNQTATIEGEQDINGTKIPSKNQFTNSCKAIGIESVTVEADTFDAMRFDCEANMTITITMQDNPIETSIKFNTINWYAENIGLVKTVTTGEGLDSTIELLSYNIP